MSKFDGHGTVAAYTQASLNYSSSEISELDDVIIQH